MSKRRAHSPEFKARVAMEAISGRKTLQEIAASSGINPNKLSQSKRQLLDDTNELCTRGKKTKHKDDGLGDAAWLLLQIKSLQMGQR